MRNIVEEQKKLNCPFCETELEKQPYITELIEKFKCPGCHTEIKHPLIRADKNGNESKNEDKVKHPITENCENCKTATNSCDRCGDFVCDEHVKSVVDVSEKFSNSQKNQLKYIAGNSENVCITCMMAIISGVKQQNIENYNSSIQNRFRKRSFPWLIFLPILALIAFLMSKVACK